MHVGHAHRTRGSTGTVEEQTYARAAAEECARRLQALGHTRLMLLADAPVPRCDRFAAIHGDGSVQPDARGAWKVNYTKDLGGYDGAGKANKVRSKASIIVEGGFLTNPEERAWMTSKAGIDAMAQALVAAFTEHEADGAHRRRGRPARASLTTLQLTGTDVAAWQSQRRLVRLHGRCARRRGRRLRSDTAAASARFMRAAMGVDTDDPRIGPNTLDAMTAELDRLWSAPRPIDFEVVAVWRSHHDRALAEATGALLGLRVLPESHRERARRAFVVGAAQHADASQYEERRAVAGRTAADTSRACAELIREWIDAGQPTGLRALRFT